MEAQKEFEDRLKIKDQKRNASAAEIYTCGCGSQIWHLIRNGDCVCARCMRAQARIKVTELAPVSAKAGA